MFLKKIIIVNYKSCQKIELDLIKDEPLVLIGINDCGKSTILRAVDLLFDGKTTFNYQKEDKVKTDISNTNLSIKDFDELFKSLNLPSINYQPNQTVILAELKVETEDLFSGFEENISPHLIWTIEKSINDTIYLAKIFDGNTQSTIDLLMTADQKSQPLNLWASKDKDLKEIRKKNNISDEQIENENKAGRFKKIEQFRAVYNKIGYEFVWSKYNDKKKDKSFFPEVGYLDWNFSFEELTDFCTSVMNKSIEQYENAVKKYANEQRIIAQEQIDKNFGEIVDFLSKEIKTISKIKSNLFFNVQHKLTDLVINKITTDKDIHLESQGDGIKRQIWFALIKWKAKETLENKTSNKKLIWCFDEPETHLYPAAQRDFFDKIKEVNKGNVQTIISTHSTVFIDKTKMTNIKKVTLNSGYSLIDSCRTSEEVFESLKIRNSDFLFYDKFVVVEGSTDLNLIPGLFKIYTTRNLRDYNAQIIRLDGETKVKENKDAFKNILNEFRKSEDSTIYIFDNDALLKYGKKEFEKDIVFFIGKQDLEDSINSDIWEKFVNDKIKEYENPFTFTLKEIDNLKSSIPSDKEINKNQKFYEKLRSTIRQKTNNIELLPDKGDVLATELIKYLQVKDDIPKQLLNAFDEIMKTNNN